MHHFLFHSSEEAFFARRIILSGVSIDLVSTDQGDKLDEG